MFNIKLIHGRVDPMIADTKLWNNKTTPHRKTTTGRDGIDRKVVSQAMLAHTILNELWREPHILWKTTNRSFRNPTTRTVVLSVQYKN